MDLLPPPSTPLLLRRTSRLILAETASPRWDNIHAFHGQASVGIGKMMDHAATPQCKKRLDTVFEDDATNTENNPVCQENNTQPTNDEIIIDDLALLPNLTPQTALSIIKQRWLSQRPFTNAHSIVIVCNPYAHVKCTDIDPARALAARALQRCGAVGTTNKNMQIVVVCGESGSGKTETLKHMLHHVAHGPANRVCAANPLIEAFGNASTRMNGNSSRFVKLTNLHFSNDGTCLDTCTRTMLFEKSRVTHRVQGERNFHAFYQLLRGLRKDKTIASWLGVPHGSCGNDWAILKCDTASSSCDDLKGANETLRSMSDVGMTAQDRNGLFKLLAAVLHLGELVFITAKDGTTTQLDDASSVRLSRHVARLLGLSALSLTQALCCRTMSIVNGGLAKESYVTSLTIAQAEARRDCLAREIYSRAFAFVVNATNSSMSGTTQQQHSTLSFVDIMGFETSGALSTFETFLVNYANEKLHQVFIKSAVRDVQLDYQNEGLTCWEPITFTDNSNIIGLFENPIHGLFAVLDDAAKLGGNARTPSYVSKCRTLHSGSPYFSCDKRTSSTLFTIAHFAGSVTYDSNDFIQKNLDAADAAVLQLLESANLVGQPTATSLPSSVVVTNAKKLSCPSLSAHFKADLDKLIDDLSHADVHYVRCLRPNTTQSSTEFDSTLVHTQMCASGVVAAVKVARGSFAHRMSIVEYESRYRGLILDDETKLGNKFVRGKTAIFMGDVEYQTLEQAKLVRDGDMACRIQACVRGWLMRLAIRRQRVLVMEAVVLYWVRCEEEELERQAVAEEAAAMAAAAAAMAVATEISSPISVHEHVDQETVVDGDEVAVSPQTPPHYRAKFVEQERRIAELETELWRFRELEISRTMNKANDDDDDDLSTQLKMLALSMKDDVARVHVSTPVKHSGGPPRTPKTPTFGGTLALLRSGIMNRRRSVNTPNQCRRMTVAATYNPQEIIRDWTLDQMLRYAGDVDDDDDVGFNMRQETPVIGGGGGGGAAVGIINEIDVD